MNVEAEQDSSIYKLLVLKKIMNVSAIVAGCEYLRVPSVLTRETLSGAGAVVLIESPAQYDRTLKLSALAVMSSFHTSYPRPLRKRNARVRLDESKSIYSCHSPDVRCIREIRASLSHFITQFRYSRLQKLEEFCDVMKHRPILIEVKVRNVDDRNHRGEILERFDTAVLECSGTKHRGACTGGAALVR